MPPLPALAAPVAVLGPPATERSTSGHRWRSDRIILLGTDAGPRINTFSTAKSASALVVDDTVYLVDSGLDTANRFVAADLTFDKLRTSSSHIIISIAPPAYPDWSCTAG